MTDEYGMRDSEDVTTTETSKDRAAVAAYDDDQLRRSYGYFAKVSTGARQKRYLAVLHAELEARQLTPNQETTEP